MRILQNTGTFRADYKKIKKDKVLTKALKDVIGLLVNEDPLPAELDDHQLIGNWSGHRECHIQPDFLFIYKLIETESGDKYIFAVRCGNHSQLFS